MAISKRLTKKQNEEYTSEAVDIDKYETKRELTKDIYKGEGDTIRDSMVKSKRRKIF